VNFIFLVYVHSIHSDFSVLYNCTMKNGTQHNSERTKLAEENPERYYSVKIVMQNGISQIKLSEVFHVSFNRYHVIYTRQAAENP